MSTDITKNTDYVSLRRLLEYHNEVVKPAIEDAGTIKDIKIGTTSLTIEADGAVTLPVASSTTTGLMTPLLYNLANAAVTQVQISPTYPNPWVEGGTLYMPLASYDKASAGLLSNEDYKILKSLGTILGDADTSEGVIDTLYEVIDFLDKNTAGTELVTILNAKADKDDLSDYAKIDGTNTFTGTNSFSGATVIFTAPVSQNGTTQNAANFNGSIGIGTTMGRMTINNGSFSNGTKVLNLPFTSAANGDYLTIVKKYGEDDTTAATAVSVLSECATITKDMFATA